MTIWFASDHHFGHESIRAFEPAARGRFATTEEMDEAIVATHNALVDPDDTVYLLGDLAMGELARSLARAARLNGRLLLVPGNHDRHSSAYEKREWKRAERAAAYLDHGVESLPETTTIELDGAPLLLSHYPYRGVEGADTTGEERYARLRPVDEGLPLVHGHVHSLWRERGRMLNVGIDANALAPTSEHEVRRWLARLGAR